MGDLMARKSPHTLDLGAVWAAADLTGSKDVPAMSRDRLDRSDPDQRDRALLAWRKAGFADMETDLDRSGRSGFAGAARKPRVGSPGTTPIAERAVAVLADGVTAEDWWNTRWMPVA